MKMKKTALILCMVPVLFSCGKTEEIYLFEKGSANHSASAAVMAEKCKNDNKKLIDNLDKTSSFKNLFTNGQSERVFKLQRTRSYSEAASLTDMKDDKAAITFNQYIRIVKPSVEGDDMLVQFSSSGNPSNWGKEQETKTFMYSQADNKELQNEIISGVCNGSDKSYSGSIGASKTQLKFSDIRTITKKVDDKDQIQKQVKEQFILDSGFPMFFYRYNGSTEMIDRVNSSAVTKVNYTVPKISEIKVATERTKCETNAEGYEGCNAVLLDLNVQSCNYELTQSHSLNEDPDTYLTYFTNCTGK
jgi:hypothetical protein